jgi:four helix bundle protein
MTNYSFPFQKTDAYGIAKRIAVEVQEAKIGNSELRDQATRAAIGAFLQLSEGLPNQSAAMRRRYFTIARNSLCEVVAAVDLASALGAIEPRRAQAVLELAARLGAILVALLR